MRGEASICIMKMGTVAKNKSSPYQDWLHCFLGVHRHHILNDIRAAREHFRRVPRECPWPEQQLA